MWALDEDKTDGKETHGFYREKTKEKEKVHLLIVDDVVVVVVLVMMKAKNYSINVAQNSNYLIHVCTISIRISVRQ
jgi:hypothetical protein